VNASTALRALSGQLKSAADLVGLIAETLPLRRDGRAMQLIPWGAVWAAGSLNCLKTFPALPGAKSLSIFADDSGIGLEAARICRQRWIAAGREAAIHVPPAGLDWNGAARRRRP
jgi:hypothetical protein